MRENFGEKKKDRIWREQEFCSIKQIERRGIMNDRCCRADFRAKKWGVPELENVYI